ncbi:ABC transporter permease [Poseidonibacter ostreae]|jgi:putative ABC transport system permease protein|uniref:ABC transporter permease n=1 Tax=Poseidonibacter ostreae TaxID=2654171 RepID=A0A6L4WTD4_9BACT|nr:ABC transporter permease [Poseidonibacter ostreae]KAB7884393.1 ABC transporter permease [Poseidonibacter ostreae]KAB7889298.1 ABC transporter permease [Poseidonibacter ostreae]KAB7892143.1 ABC transporter permease [Poseidonibacter ostreae]
MKTIELYNLLYLLFPLIIVWYFYKSWVKNSYEIINATIRMIIQLLLIGYVLVYLFNNENTLLGIFILLFMMIVSTYIARRNIKNKSKYEYLLMLTSLSISGLIHLIIIIEFVLKLENIYIPKYVIPIAGMLFANIMNSLSLGIECFEREYTKTKNFIEARSISFKTSMIPQINSLLAVGLVSLPGMMTGQILSGVDPLIAVRYQIMIMAIVLSSSGISIIIYFLLKNKMYK